MSLGERLKEERQRLNLTQDALALASNSNKRQQIKYEQDDQAPGAGYLAAACRVGIDVVYVLTGLRAGTLPPAEAALVSAYRAASPEIQNAALAVLGAPAAAPRSRSQTILRGNTIGQQISGDQSLPALTTVNVGIPRRE